MTQALVAHSALILNNHVLNTADVSLLLLLLAAPNPSILSCLFWSSHRRCRSSLGQDVLAFIFVMVYLRINRVGMKGRVWSSDAMQLNYSVIQG